MNSTRHRIGPMLSFLLVCSMAPAVLSAQSATTSNEVEGTEMQSEKERDQAFAAKLEGAKLVGKFNLISAQGESAAQTDNYSVSRLERGADNTWIFNYSMSYGQGPDGPKMTVPIPVVVEWAGDTPMLTMTKQSVEGLGTFSVRVLIYGDLYAGTWDNGTLGGHMWGRIVQDDEISEEVDNKGADGER